MSNYRVKPRYCGDFRIYQHYRFNVNTSTGNGLVDLLIRHGVVPTMDSKKDVDLAREFMPKPNWSDMLTEINMRHSANNNKTDEQT